MRFPSVIPAEAGIQRIKERWNLILLQSLRSQLLRHTRRPIRLKSDSEVGMPGIGGHVGDSCFGYVAGEGLLDLSNAGDYVLRFALGDHSDSPVRQIAHITCEKMTICDSMGGEPKSDALNPPDEDYVFCTAGHFCSNSLSLLASAHPKRRHLAYSDDNTEYGPINVFSAESKELTELAEFERGLVWNRGLVYIVAFMPDVEASRPAKSGD